MALQAGYAANGIPYARLSDNGPVLVIFTGSELEHKAPSKLTQQVFRMGVKRLAQQYTLYLLSRKPNLPPGYTAQNISDDFAEMIRTEIGRPVHVMGMSSGGSSAMHFAVDHVDLVDKLVLAMTAHRLSEQGKQICMIWRDLALAGKWPDLWERMGLDAAEGAKPAWLIRLMMRRFGGVILGKPTSGADLAIVLAADINLAVSHKLPTITAPTLVIGGTVDPFYTADTMRETAALIPNAELQLIEGSGHAIVKTHPQVFQERVMQFLQAN